MERILCAAVHVDDSTITWGNPVNVRTGYVLGGYRHPYIRAALVRFNYKENIKITDGFLTSKNRFVSREEAFEIAEKAGQLVPFSDEYETRTLISEDLY